MITRLLVSCFLFVDAEGDGAIVDVVGKGVSHHGDHHDDVLTCLLHREEGNDVVGQILPAESFKQYPADTKLQSKTQEETADEKQQLSLEIVLGLEDPVAVPQETVDDTEDVTHDIRDTVGQTQSRVEQVEDDKRDERVKHTYHSIFEQLNARLSGFGLVNLHDNSFNSANLDNFNELTKFF